MTRSRITAIHAEVRRLRLLNALRSVDAAIDRLDLRADIHGLERLREDLRSALRSSDERLLRE